MATFCGRFVSPGNIRLQGITATEKHSTLVACENQAHHGGVHAFTSTSPNVLYSAAVMQIVAGTNQGRIYRVRLDNLASIVVSENHRGSVTCVSYARGVSDRFATASVDGTVRVWDTADYGVLTTAVVRDAGEPLCLVLTQVRTLRPRDRRAHREIRAKKNT